MSGKEIRTKSSTSSMFWVVVAQGQHIFSPIRRISMSIFGPNNRKSDLPARSGGLWRYRCFHLNQNHKCWKPTWTNKVWNIEEVLEFTQISFRDTVWCSYAPQTRLLASTHPLYQSTHPALLCWLKGERLTYENKVWDSPYDTKGIGPRLGALWKKSALKRT